ncbi:NUDIX domain-containing protein [Kitasatospora sp. NPDC004745]|uniref:NUDIX domain-containing protein n=1 Tax=Kitasatospora sp. NPDC004745 TaxID=3364019 RepID=UPI0036B800AA
MRTFTKTYDHPLIQQRSLAHHRWLTGVNPDVRTPQIVEQLPGESVFEHLDGRHAGPADLAVLAGPLGRQHTSVYFHELAHARLDGSFTSRGTTTIDGFVDSRRERLRHVLTSVPEPALTLEAIEDWLEKAADMPAASYQDANPRNLLVEGATVAVIDFDFLALAPFGYDVAAMAGTRPDRAGSPTSCGSPTRSSHHDDQRRRELPERGLRDIPRQGHRPHRRRAYASANWSPRLAWTVPGGRTEPGEALDEAAARELKEETGLLVDPVNLELVHVVHVEQSYDGLGQFVLFVFATDRWTGELVNTEPDKQLAVEWIAAADLPEPAFPTARIALAA